VEEEALDEGAPLVLESGAVENAAGARVPVVGVGEGTFAAVKVGVDGHAFGRVELIDEGVGAGPVAFGVPPEGDEGFREVVGRKVVREGRLEVIR